MGKQRSRQLQDGRGTSNRNYRQEMGDKTHVKAKWEEDTLRLLVFA